MRSCTALTATGAGGRLELLLPAPLVWSWDGGGSIEVLKKLSQSPVTTCKHPPSDHERHPRARGHLHKQLPPPPAPRKVRRQPQPGQLPPPALQPWQMVLPTPSLRCALAAAVPRTEGKDSGD
ncbi:uncharacterized protein LOC144804738 [Lissotriton helveticus]